jgi:hypothetical protein
MEQPEHELCTGKELIERREARGRRAVLVGVEQHDGPTV